MRTAIFIFLTLITLWSCRQSTADGSTQDTNQEVQSKPANYGQKVTEEGVITAQELKEKMSSGIPEMQAKVKGEVVEVCQKEGCWLNMDMGDGTKMQVNMSGHSFFVPKDISGKTVIVDGRAYMDTTSVEDLRHFAEDAGKGKKEIEAINEPQVELVFDAKGVLIK